MIVIVPRIRHEPAFTTCAKFPFSCCIVAFHWTSGIRIYHGRDQYAPSGQEGMVLGQSTEYIQWPASILSHFVQLTLQSKDAPIWSKAWNELLEVSPLCILFCMGPPSRTWKGQTDQNFFSHIDSAIISPNGDCTGDIKIVCTFKISRFALNWTVGW